MQGKFRMAAWPIVLMLLLCASARGRAQQPAAPSTLVVQNPGPGLVPLGGKWEFHTGDNMAWAMPEFDDSAWEGIDVDSGWGAQGHLSYTGYAWYRRHIDFVGGTGAPQDLALMVPLVDGPYEVFWNGRMIGSVGRLPPHATSHFRPAPYSFGLGRAGQGVLALRVWKAPLRFTDSGNFGELLGTPIAGSGAAIAAQLGSLDHKWLRDRQFYFDLNLLYGLIAVLGLLAWLRGREHKLLLWVSLFALSAPLHVLLFNAHLPLSVDFATGVDSVAEGLRDISLWFLLLYLLKLDDRSGLRRWTRILAIVAAIGWCLNGLTFSQDWSSAYGSFFQIANGVLAFSLYLIELFPLVLIWFARGKRLSAASWLVALFASLAELLSVVYVTALQGIRFTHWTLAKTITTHLFTVRGNYFDAEGIANAMLLLAILYAVYRYAIEQNVRQGVMEQEFRSAQEVQHVLIPETLPPVPGYAVTSAYLPARDVGGDFFQLIARPHGAAVLVLGDVSGKGLKAAMTVSLIVGVVQALAAMFDDPSEILASLNDRLYGRMNGGFVTCLVLRLSANGECTIANAGHLSPFVNARELDLPPALPLGIVPETSYDTIEVHLSAHDCLTIYTDGLLEARNHTGELYGFERVRELMATRPDAAQASNAAVQFGQDDDITVITVTRLAVGVESTTSLSAPVLVSTHVNFQGYA